MKKSRLLAIGAKWCVQQRQNDDISLKNTTKIFINSTYIMGLVAQVTGYAPDL